MVSNNIKTIFEKTIYILTAVFFILIISKGVYLNCNFVPNYASFILLIILLFAFFIFLFSLFVNKEKYEKKIRLICWILMVSIQIFIIKSFDVNQLTDAYMINDQARALALNHSFSVPADNIYFQIYSNNHLTCVFTTVFYKLLILLGINIQTNTPLAIIDMIAVDTFYFLSQRALDRLERKKIATGFLIFLTFNPFSYLYLYWTYTINYCLPFIGAELLFMALIETSDNYESRRYIYAAGLGLALVIGSFIRPIVAIPVIAYGLFIIINRFKKPEYKTILVFITFICVCLITVFGIKSINNKVFPPSERYFPYTHWVMMGLNENGVISTSDFDFTYSFETTSKMKEATEKEIVKRLKEFDFPGDYIKHIYNKVTRTWSEGSGYFYDRFDADTKFPGLYEWLVGSKSPVIILYCQAYRITTFLMALFLMIRMIMRSKRGSVDFFIVTTIFGGILFYLLWEAKTNYSVPFIPFILVLSAEEFLNLTKIIDTHFDSRSIKTITAFILIFFIAVSIKNTSFFTNQYEINEYTIKSALIDWWLYNDSVDSVAEEQKSLKQTFTAEKSFSEVCIRCRILENSPDTEYKGYILDRDGEIIVEKIISKGDVQDNYICFNIGKNLLLEPGKYTLIVKPKKEQTQKDSIEWLYRKSIASSQYEGNCTFGNEEMPDLNMVVYKRESNRFFSKPVYFVIVFLQIAFILFAGHILCNKVGKKKIL